MPPLILITNDDGIYSPGLRAAIETVQDLGELFIVAPTEQQSAMGRSLPPSFDGRIFATSLTCNGQPQPAYHLNGSPAQAVLYGIIDLAPRWPDLVISGINHGENLGTNTSISGTVGAALQGGDMGIPSLAFSLETDRAYHYNHGDDVNWEIASYWLRHFARKLLARPDWPQDVAVLKIDIPATATRNTSWRLTRQSRQPYYASYPTGRKKPDEPRVLDYYVSIDRDSLEPDSDIYAFVIDRVISVTPLSVDLTARISFPRFEATLRET